MKRSVLVPLGVALGAVLGKAIAPDAAPGALQLRPHPRTAPLSQGLLALASSAERRLPLAHFSHSSHVSHASHVSHGSHASHFSSSAPPPVTPPPVTPPPSSSGTGGSTSTLPTALSTDLERGIEQQGVTYGGAHKAITSAVCLGEAKYGAKWVGVQLEYHRFSCDLTDANYNLYGAEVVITKTTAKYFWWRVVSIRPL